MPVNAGGFAHTNTTANTHTHTRAYIVTVYDIRERGYVGGKYLPAKIRAHYLERN